MRAEGVSKSVVKHSCRPLKVVTTHEKSLVLYHGISEEPGFTASASLLKINSAANNHAQCCASILTVDYHVNDTEKFPIFDLILKGMTKLKRFCG